VLCPVQEKPITGPWQHCHFLSFPYYLVGTCGAGLMVIISRSSGWLPSLMVLPLWRQGGGSAIGCTCGGTAEDMAEQPPVLAA
jgi:hypothetical protein